MTNKNTYTSTITIEELIKSESLSMLSLPFINKVKKETCKQYSFIECEKNKIIAKWDRLFSTKKFKSSSLSYQKGLRSIAGKEIRIFEKKLAQIQQKFPFFFQELAQNVSLDKHIKNGEITIEDNTSNIQHIVLTPEHYIDFSELMEQLIVAVNTNDKDNMTQLFSTVHISYPQRIQEVIDSFQGLTHNQGSFINCISESIANTSKNQGGKALLKNNSNITSTPKDQMTIKPSERRKPCRSTLKKIPFPAALSTPANYDETKQETQFCSADVQESTLESIETGMVKRNKGYKKSKKHNLPLGQDIRIKNPNPLMITHNQITEEEPSLDICCTPLTPKKGRDKLTAEDVINGNHTIASSPQQLDREVQLKTFVVKHFRGGKAK